MSGVDVRAVLDELACDMGDTPGTTGDQVAQVRAAWAELIEAASAGHEMQAHGGGTALYFNVDKADRLRAALARCQPGEMPTELNIDTPAPVAPGGAA